MRKDWLEHITADHYVISANGENDNPDAEVIEWIAEAQGRRRIRSTSRDRKLVNIAEKGRGGAVSAKVNKAIADTAAVAVKRKIVFRDDNAASVMVHLGSEKVKF